MAHGASARRALVVVTVAALVAVSCSSGDGDPGAGTETARSSASSTSTTTSARVRVPDASELEGALLTVSDLPPGWGGPPATEEEDDDDPASTFCDGQRSPLADDDGLDDIDEVEVRFSKGGLLPQLVEVLAVLPADEAEARFDDARVVVDSCRGKSWTETDEDGVTTTWTLGEVSMPSVGEDSFAARLNGEIELGAITVDLLFFRQGAVVGALGGIGGTVALIGTGVIESSEYVAIAEAADTKLEKLTGA